jgi:hypothetical protein
LAGYNWRNTLGNATSVSGILAGFAIAFLGLILQSQKDLTLLTITNVSGGFSLSANLIGLFLSAISATLFIASFELSLEAKTFDVWALPKEYEKFLRSEFKKGNESWPRTRNQQDVLCRKYADLSRHLYNIGVFAIFSALGFAILPHSLSIGVAAAAIGWVAEIAQILLFRWKPPIPHRDSSTVNQPDVRLDEEQQGGHRSVEIVDALVIILIVLITGTAATVSYPYVYNRMHALAEVLVLQRQLTSRIGQSNSEMVTQAVAVFTAGVAVITPMVVLFTLIEQLKKLFGWVLKSLRKMNPE